MGCADTEHSTPIPQLLWTALARAASPPHFCFPSSRMRDPGWGCRDPDQRHGQADCFLTPGGRPREDAAAPGAGDFPQHHTCMSASSSCLRRRMFSSSWHSSGVRSLGTVRRHSQVSTCGPGNHPTRLPGPVRSRDAELPGAHRSWAGKQRPQLRNTAKCHRQHVRNARVRDGPTGSGCRGELGTASSC